MKLAYFTDSTFPSLAGIANSIINISCGLADNGHKILIFGPKSRLAKRVFWKSKNISIELVPSLPTFFNPNLRIASPISPKIMRRIKKFDPDIIHFHTSFLIGAGSVFLGRMLKKPVVGTFHSYFMQPEVLTTVGLNGEGKIISNMLWKYAAFFYNQCDLIIAPTSIVKQDLVKNEIKRPIRVLSNSINENLIKLVNDEQIVTLKKKYRLKEKVVLYVGRLSRDKSIDQLIRSFAYVIKKLPDTSLFIIGDGKIRKELKELTRKLKLSKNVVFAGGVSQDKLLGAGYYQVADIFATASQSETQGISSIEAMYFGLPIVGISKRGTLETVKNVGLLTRPGNLQNFARQIIKLLENPELKESLSDSSKKKFESSYSLNKIVGEYEDFYRRVIKLGPSHK